MTEPCKLHFLFGIAQIAASLGVTEPQVEKMIAAGEIRVKEDPLGRPVLCNWDFLQSPEGRRRLKEARDD